MNADGWRAWRDAQITDLLTPTRTLDGRPYLDGTVVARKSKMIYDMLNACAELVPGILDASGELGPVLGNLLVFTEAEQRVLDPDHLFAMSIPDLDYIDKIRESITLPPLLRSEPFLNAVSNPDTYQVAYDMIMESNRDRPEQDKWIPFLYKSRFLTTPDESGTYGRFFVFVPGETDKWIQFGIVTPDMLPRRVNNLSITALRKIGQELPKTQTHIVDYWRKYHDVQSSDGVESRITLSTKVEAGMGTENCAACHKTPVLGIHPLEEYEFGPGGKLVVKTDGAGNIPKRLNALIPDYGPPYYAGWLDPDAYGPALGPVGRERNNAFMRRCTRPWNLDGPSQARVRSAMACASCHNSRFLGAINYPQATYTTIDGALVHPETGTLMPLVPAYIEEGWMPPGAALDQDEREALADCLMLEYLDLTAIDGLLVEWLKGEG